MKKDPPKAVAFILASIQLADSKEDEGMFLTIEAGPDGVTIRLFNSGLDSEPELALTHEEFLRGHAVIANACEIFQEAKQLREAMVEHEQFREEMHTRRPGKRFRMPPQ